MKQELTPLIVQDAQTKQVLSLFYCNAESLKRVRKTGFVWRYSRSKARQIMKGATSGNVQKLVSLSYDCDKDALLALMDQQGIGACHKNTWSCFGQAKARSWGVLDDLIKVIADRKVSKPKGSFVASIINRPQAIGEKLEEEAAELREALIEKKDSEVVWEAADLIFFTLVALSNRELDLEEVIQELKRRRK